MSLITILSAARTTGGPDGQIIRYGVWPESHGEQYTERSVFVPGGPVVATGDQLAERELLEIPGVVRFAAG